MSKALYKVGDRLKVVGNPQDDWAGSDWYYGDYMTVAQVEADGDYAVYFDWKTDDSMTEWPKDAKCGLMEPVVELADIADSPLYKALK